MTKSTLMNLTLRQFSLTRMKLTSLLIFKHCDESEHFLLGSRVTSRRRKWHNYQDFKKSKKPYWAGLKVLFSGVIFRIWGLRMQKISQVIEWSWANFSTFLVTCSRKARKNGNSWWRWWKEVHFSKISERRDTIICHWHKFSWGITEKHNCAQ